MKGINAKTRRRRTAKAPRPPRKLLFTAGAETQREQERMPFLEFSVSDFQRCRDCLSQRFISERL
jgi:hypothetical protein